MMQEMKRQKERIEWVESVVRKRTCRWFNDTIEASGMLGRDEQGQLIWDMVWIIGGWTRVTPGREVQQV